MPPKAVITGTGRNGSRWIANVLSAAGLETSHECWFNGRGVQHESGVIESSWLAVPELDDFDGVIGVQLRDPQQVIQSLLGAGAHGQFSKEGRKQGHYFDWIVEWLPNIKDMDPPEAAQHFVAHWLHRVMWQADYIWTVESLDVQRVEDVAYRLGGVMLGSRAVELALATFPPAKSRHLPDRSITWSHLPINKDRRLIAKLVQQFYDIPTEG
jgi:hypothetical protein